jgi:hypothetical protein
MLHASMNRRRYERLPLRPMYTPISVRVVGERTPRRLGHAYDLSEGGVQFELDDPLPAGTPVMLCIELPASFGAGSGETAEIRVRGNIVWTDASEPGPVRQAAVFTRFASEEDRILLLQRINRVARTRNAA